MFEVDLLIFLFHSRSYVGQQMFPYLPTYFCNTLMWVTAKVVLVKTFTIISVCSSCSPFFCSAYLSLCFSVLGQCSVPCRGEHLFRNKNFKAFLKIYSEMFIQKIMSAAACFIKESLFRNVYRNMTALNLDSWSLISAKIQNWLNKKIPLRHPVTCNTHMTEAFKGSSPALLLLHTSSMWSLQIAASWPIYHVCLFVLLLIFDLSKRQTKSVAYANLWICSQPNSG